MRSSSRRFSAAALAASLALGLLSAQRARADAPTPPPATTKAFAFDSSRPATVIEKLQSAQDQQIFGFPIYGSEQSTWTPLCVAPCHLNLDPDGVYRVGPFNGVTASTRFTLPPQATTLHIDAGRAGLRRAGTLLILIGATVLVGGGSTLLAATDNAGRYAGVAIGGAGLLSVLVSIPFLVLSGTGLRFE